MVLGCVLFTAGNYAGSLTSLELLNYYLTLAMSIDCVSLSIVSNPNNQKEQGRLFFRTDPDQT